MIYLFISLFENENYFFKKTKLIYKTDAIKLSVERITELKEQLTNNIWFSYFKNHMKEVDTWIDFENKIEEVLIAIGEVFPYINDLNDSGKTTSSLSGKTETGKILNNKNYKILSNFDFFIQRSNGVKDNIYLNKLFSPQKKLQNGFDVQIFLNSIQMQLDEFIKLFNSYLNLIISQPESCLSR